MVVAKRFEELKLPELKEAASFFGVEGKSRDDIIANLHVDGVTWSMYKKEFNIDDPDEDEESGVSAKEADKAFSSKKRGTQIVVKMDRENPSYQDNGYRWDKTHPYALMDVDDFEDLVQREQGFRQATPKEVAEYYS